MPILIRLSSKTALVKVGNKSYISKPRGPSQSHLRSVSTTWHYFSNPLFALILGEHTLPVSLSGWRAFSSQFPLSPSLSPWPLNLPVSQGNPSGFLVPSACTHWLGGYTVSWFSSHLQAGYSQVCIGSLYLFPEIKLSMVTCVFDISNLSCLNQNP